MMMLAERRPILLANARILDPSRDLDIDGDLLIADGVIREAKRGIGAAGVPEATEVIDCKGKVVAPGLIDMRAFVGEPGAEYRETIASASQAAAAGGVTTIVSQPDTTPAIDDPAIVDFIMRRARDTSIVHVQPMAALTKGLRGEEMAEIGLLKASGAVAFTDGAKSVTNAQVMRRALTYARDFDALIVHHTEDPDIVGEGVMNEGEFAARLGLTGVPTAAETIMLERDLRLVALTESRYHAASLTCDESLEVLAPRQGRRLARHRLRLHQPSHAQRDRRRALPHLPQAQASAARRGGPRGAGRRARRGADRCRHVRSQPAGRGDETPAVCRGLAWRHRARDDADGGAAPRARGRACAHDPAQGDVERAGEILGLPGGTLRQGSPADVIVLDPDVPWVLDPAELKSKCKNTPFDEAKLEGRVVRTIVAGRTVYEYV